MLSPSIGKPLDRKDLAAATLLAWMFGFLYVWNSVPWLQGGDNGEFVALAFGPGVAHPPGYPWYVQWLRIVAPWFVDPPAAAAAKATGLVAGLALGVTFLAARSHLATRPTALVGTCLLAGHPLFVKYATQAEVFVPGLLTAGLVVWASGPGLSLAAAWRRPLLAWLAGIALSHHHTAVFLAPLGLWAYFGLDREPLKPSDLALSLVALVIGLSPYLWLLRAEESRLLSSFCAPSDFYELAGVFLRRGYGTFSLRQTSGASHSLHTSLLFFLCFVLFFLPLVLCARPRAVSALGGWAWLGSLALNVAFVFWMGAPDTSVGDEVGSRFFLLPMWVVLVWWCSGRPSYVLSHGRWRFAWAGLSLLLGPALGASGMRSLLSVPSNTVENRVRVGLESARPNGIILTADDSFLFVGKELQREGVRADVSILAAGATSSKCASQRYSEHLGQIFNAAPGKSAGLRELVMAALASQRPVYVAGKFSDDLWRALPRAAEGLLVRIASPSSQLSVNSGAESLTLSEPFLSLCLDAKGWDAAACNNIADVLMAAADRESDEQKQLLLARSAALRRRP